MGGLLMKHLHEKRHWLRLFSKGKPDDQTMAGDFSVMPGQEHSVDRAYSVGPEYAALISAVVVCAIMGFYALYTLRMREVEDGSVIDARTLSLATPDAVNRVQIALPATEPSAAVLQAAQISVTLYIITERAGTVTASVAIADNRARRIVAAGNASQNVVRYAQLAEELEPGSIVADTLQELALALSVYDVDRVRNASLRLAEMRQQLLMAVNASFQGYTTPLNSSWPRVLGLPVGSELE